MTATKKRRTAQEHEQEKGQDEVRGRGEQDESGGVEGSRTTVEEEHEGEKEREEALRKEAPAPVDEEGRGQGKWRSSERGRRRGSLSRRSTRRKRRGETPAADLRDPSQGVASYLGRWMAAMSLHLRRPARTPRRAVDAPRSGRRCRPRRWQRPRSELRSRVHVFTLKLVDADVCVHLHKHADACTQIHI